jgi:MFS family permease
VYNYLANLFINRDYALFTGGSFISATGSWFLSVTVGWLVWEIGQSELLLGIANFAQMGPMLVLGLVGGVVADRVERRLLILVAQFIVIASSSTLAVLVATQIATIPAILGLLLVIGVSQSFAWPAWSPFIADIVGPERLRPAIALNSARFNLTRIIGPSLAGVLLAQLGATICLAIAAVGQLFLVLTMAIIRPRTQRRAPSQETILGAIRTGLSLSWRTRAVREPMLLGAVIGVLILPYIVFLPAFAQNVLQTGPEGYGLLLTAGGVGAIAGAIAAGSPFVASRPRAAQGALAIVTGLSLAAFAFSTWLPLSLAALLVVGFGSIGYQATANATVQLAVPREVIGRVMGIWVVVAAGSTPIGGMLLGWFAERAGLQPTLSAAGLVAVLFTLGVMARPGHEQAETPAGQRESTSTK